MARVGDRMGAYRVFFLWKTLMEIDPFEDTGIDGRIIFKMIFKKWEGKAWTGFT